MEAKTRTLQNVQYSFEVGLFEKEEDNEPSKTIEILFPLNHAPVVPRQNDLYYTSEDGPYVVVRVSHAIGKDRADETLGRHIITIRGVRAIILPE